MDLNKYCSIVIILNAVLQRMGLDPVLIFVGDLEVNGKLLVIKFVMLGVHLHETLNAQYMKSTAQYCVTAKAVLMH